MENEKIAIPYMEEYSNFIKNYKTSQVSGEEVGGVIARMAGYFAEYNMKLVNAERNLYIMARDIEERTDETSGKTITSSKAQALVRATNEHYIADELKAHVKNVEQFVNALKSLQRGVLSEYAMSNL